LHSTKLKPGEKVFIETFDAPDAVSPTPLGVYVAEPDASAARVAAAQPEGVRRPGGAGRYDPARRRTGGGTGA